MFPQGSRQAGNRKRAEQTIPFNVTVKTGADMSTRRLALISAGAIMTIVGSLVIREARRLAAIDIAALYDAHRQAGQVGGVGAFLVFFAINAAVITASVLIVRRALGRQN